MHFSVTNNAHLRAHMCSLVTNITLLSAKAILSTRPS